MKLSEQVANLEDKYIKLWEVVQDLYDVIDQDWLAQISSSRHKLLTEGVMTMDLEATRKGLGFPD